MRLNMFARTINTCVLLLALCGTAVAQRVNNAEYFWGNDPGAGNATPLQAVDGAFDEALEAILLNTATLPGLGAHVLSMRVQDRTNAWGPTFRTTVVIEGPVATVPDIRVTNAEYFWDTDPGEGSATPMLAFDGNFNDALESIALETSSLPANGVHVLNVRAHEVQGAWGTPFRVVVEVIGGTVTFPEISVISAEYYVNTDPGPGSGVPMLAVDGTFDGALEAIRGGNIPVPVIAGVNVLWMRARDAEEEWGPAFGVVVNIDTTIAGTVAVPEVLEQDAVVLMPNPTTGADGFDILLDGAFGPMRVQVVDAQGRLVQEGAFQPARRVHVALASPAPGVYSVGVFRGGTVRWSRLMVR